MMLLSAAPLILASPGIFFLSFFFPSQLRTFNPEFGLVKSPIALFPSDRRFDCKVEQENHSIDQSRDLVNSDSVEEFSRLL